MNLKHFLIPRKKKMKRAITKINDANFDAVVLFPRKPAAVFFSARWSADDAAARVVFETAAERFRENAAFYEFDVEENPIIATAYGVRRVPAILTFADGSFKESHAGFITEDSINEKIEKLTAEDEIYDTVAAFSKRIGTRVEMLLSELF